MEQRTENNLMEEQETNKSNVAENEGKKRGTYTKHKLEKKVTVKHFLNKKINLGKKGITKKGYETFSVSPAYPIYVQVTFNRRTTMLRSATEELCENDEEFQEIMDDDDDIFGQLEREKRFIEYYLKNYVDKHIELHFSRLKNKDEFTDARRELYISETFDLNSAIRGFSYYDYEINKVTDRALMFEISKFAKELLYDEIRGTNEGKPVSKECIDNHESKTKLYYYAIKGLIERPDTNISAIELLSFYEIREPKFSKLREMYSSEIWYFNTLYGLFILSGAGSFGNLGITIVDYLEGNFYKEIISTFSHIKHKIQHIFKDIDTLIEKGYYK